MYCQTYYGPRYSPQDPIVVSLFDWKIRSKRKCICKLGYSRVDNGRCVLPTDPECTYIYGPTV